MAYNKATILHLLGPKREGTEIRLCAKCGVMLVNPYGKDVMNVARVERVEHWQLPRVGAIRCDSPDVPPGRW